MASFLRRNVSHPRILHHQHEVRGVDSSAITEAASGEAINAATVMERSQGPSGARVKHAVCTCTLGLQRGKTGSYDATCRVFNGKSAELIDDERAFCVQ